MESIIALLAKMLLGLFIFALVCIVAFMRIFKKAGRSQLLAIIPIVNICVLAEVAGKPSWWGLVVCFGGLIPVAGAIISLVVWVLIMHALSLRFGKDGAFTAGLLLVPGIFHCILAFGSAEYIQPESTDIAVDA